ncbi:MAG TPA: hypothetical protein VGJ37_00235 [Pyrinomonadaceae bacterium]|jgi:hypothetical protein
MRFAKLPLVVLLSVCLSGALAVVSASAANIAQGAQSTALERGYRTGYSDGYTAGYKDISINAPRDYQSKEDYQRADRSFNEAWGTIEDYRDGYQQGFEAGYAAGYERQQFNSSLPAGFKRRGSVGPTAGDNSSASGNVPVTVSTNDQNTASTPAGNGSLSIPRNTILALELVTPVSTDASQRGDRIEARVVEPSEYAGYTVDGHVAQVKRPGKVKGVAQLQLAFDQIRSNDNRIAQLHAELVEIAPMGGDNEPQVDAEGGVRGRDSTKDDVTKVGAASGIGAIIGTIAGGGKGAAIGAIIGGGAGTGVVMTQRGKDIRLERGTHLKIRTSTDTSVL